MAERPWERKTNKAGRELLEFIGRKVKTDIDPVKPIPERLKELIEQLVQLINEREKEPKEV